MLSVFAMGTVAASISPTVISSELMRRDITHG